MWSKNYFNNRKKNIVPRFLIHIIIEDRIVLKKKNKKKIVKESLQTVFSKSSPKCDCS